MRYVTCYNVSRVTYWNTALKNKMNVDVDAPDKSSGKRVQHIHIQYDGLGFIPLNELMKEETA